MHAENRKNEQTIVERLPEQGQEAECKVYVSSTHRADSTRLFIRPCRNNLLAGIALDVCEPGVQRKLQFLGGGAKGGQRRTRWGLTPARQTSRGGAYPACVRSSSQSSFTRRSVGRAAPVNLTACAHASHSARNVLPYVMARPETQLPPKASILSKI